MRVPDTIEGALFLSGLDFVLSFFIIGGIGAVLAVLPRLDRFVSIRDADLREGH
jgi:hypothetical protein